MPTLRPVLIAALLAAAPAAAAAQVAPEAAPAAPAADIALETLSEGSGAVPADGDVVLVSYRGTLADGTMFDEGQRVLLPVSEMIPGFTRGLKRMRVGGSYRLSIPAALAYGDRQAGPIPPGSDLVFTVDLIDAGPPSRARAMQGLPPLTVEPLTAGAGRMPAADDYVLISYVVRLPDGTQVDAGDNALFALGQLVPGFAQGLTQMRVGGRYRMTVPADLAYGDRGAGPIPPRSDLVVEVELIAANRVAEIGAMMRAAAAPR